ncbi:hypothetical protein AO391_11075 [Pseudomonas marginalis ICMP 9505]|nr:hypothetical protein AO391_11075 [Pseudomonas marginalis ICMP 9505]
MTNALKTLFLGGYVMLTTGCATGDSESFTFMADFPPDFTYEAVARYAPAKGETCTVKKPHIGYNQRWHLDYKERYKRDLEIPIYRTIEGCPLVIYRVEIKVYGTYGKHRGEFGVDSAMIVIREQLEDKYKGYFNSANESAINGQCQWLFRTMGAERYISKGLVCKKIDDQGLVTKGRPVGAYTLDQLPGKTVKLKIKLAEEEKPAIGDTWIKVPNGWKRCMGKALEDQYAFCFGNHKDFSSFKMPDGRSCTIYPNCTE